MGFPQVRPNHTKCSESESARLLLNFSPILFGVFKHLVDLGFSDFQNLEKNRNECCEPGSC